LVCLAKLELVEGKVSDKSPVVAGLTVMSDYSPLQAIKVF
jgi:hypothetical protein